MNYFSGAERLAEVRRHELMEQAVDERRAQLALAERSRRPRPQVRAGRQVLEFGTRLAGFVGAALRPTPRKTA